MDNFRARTHWIIMFIGATSVGISVGCECWAATSIFAITAIGAFIFNIGAWIVEAIAWHRDSIFTILKDMEYEQLKIELEKKQKQ